MGEMMAEYVFAYLLHFSRNVGKHLKDQRKRGLGSVEAGTFKGEGIGDLVWAPWKGNCKKEENSFGMNVLGIKRVPEPVENVDQVFGSD